MPGINKNIPLQKALRSFEDVELNYVHALEERGLKFAPRNSHVERVEELKRTLAGWEKTSNVNNKRNECSSGDSTTTIYSNDAKVTNKCSTEKQVNFRNADASISTGWLSKACVECTGCGGSQTFSTTLKCHRDCYFCFNHNLEQYQKFFEVGCPWEEELRVCYKANGGKLAAMAVSGGEPLLALDDSIKLLKRVQEMFPGVHTRMYTSGDILTPATARALHEAGLREIRFSVKLQDPPEMRERVLRNLKMATDYIEDVMVEMPIEPVGCELGGGYQTEQTFASAILDKKNSLSPMQDLMLRFQDAGIRGMNLLEFCFPFHNWEAFEQRGYKLKNPPFHVMCDYSYSGGLAVAGSEEMSLELMLWALDNGITYGMHYCSLENKHRSEMLQTNAGAEKTHPIFDFDQSDYFIKTAKVFGPDREIVEPILRHAGCTHLIRDDEDESLAFPRKFLPALKCVADNNFASNRIDALRVNKCSNPETSEELSKDFYSVSSASDNSELHAITPTIAIYTMAKDDDGYFLREVGLELADCLDSVGVRG